MLRTSRHVQALSAVIFASAVIVAAHPFTSAAAKSIGLSTPESTPISTPAPTPSSAAALTGWIYAVARDGRWHRDVADPSQHAVVDGEVVGWIFGPIGTSTSPMPAASTEFPLLCPTIKRDDDPGPRVRLAVVVDSSRAPSSPRDPITVTCLTVSRGTTAHEALSQTGVAVRFDGVVLCAINDIPAEGCLDDSETVLSSTIAPSNQPTGVTSSANATPSTGSAGTPKPSSSPADTFDNAFTQTPRAWLLSGGLLLVALGLLAASNRRRSPSH